jgi:hypothetical protein
LPLVDIEPPTPPLALPLEELFPLLLDGVPLPGESPLPANRSSLMPVPQPAGPSAAPASVAPKISETIEALFMMAAQPPMLL